MRQLERSKKGKGSLVTFQIIETLQFSGAAELDILLEPAPACPEQARIQEGAPLGRGVAEQVAT